jgi:REP element-mobilizing transposase RayT
MPHIDVWIHLVWATKSRKPLLTSQIRQVVFNHIRENAKLKDIHLDFINGFSEHVHLLISMNAKQTIAEITQLIKGESSFWINKNHLTITKFEWQDDYYAVSVSHSALDSVREYIKNQELHHQHKAFDQEVDEFVRKYGFERLKD